jgi:glycosyltransferase involved in cell wall biosynthesis
MNSKKITAVILSHNNRQSILRALSSVKWCDEVLVIDDFSTDGTFQLIEKKRKVRVLQHHLKGDFASQRNFALANVSTSWVLFVDADEVVSEPLRQDLKKIVQNYTCDGCSITRRDFLWGREMRFGEYYDFSLVRFGRREKGKWIGRVHEEWKINGKIAWLRSPLYHYPYNSIDEFLKKINFYSDIRARELYDLGTKSSFWAILVYPLIKFIMNYLLRLGYKDGMQGLISAMVMSFYSFLVRAKLWLLWHEES